MLASDASPIGLHKSALATVACRTLAAHEMRAPTEADAPPSGCLSFERKPALLKLLYRPAGAWPSSSPRFRRSSSAKCLASATRYVTWTGSPATSPCSSRAMTCSRLSAWRSFLHPHPTSSPRKRLLPSWFAKCLEQSLNLKRPAALRNWQPLASASASVRDGAREGSRLVRHVPRLSPLPVSYDVVVRRAGNCHCAKCRRSWQLAAISSTARQGTSTVHKREARQGFCPEHQTAGHPGHSAYINMKNQWVNEHTCFRYAKLPRL